MSAPSRSTSDVAGDVLRQAFRRRELADTTIDFSSDRGWWDRDLIELFRIAWHELPLVRQSPVPSFLPIGRFDQAVFAEAFRQSLAEGFPFHEALELAAEVNPCPCFRRALRVMFGGVCTGHSLAWSLKQSRAWVGRALPAALEVGEEFGCLPEALAAFVRQVPALTGPRYRRAIGRRWETARFAQALAALLRDHPLTPGVVQGAGRLAGGSRRFAVRVHAVGQAMDNGAVFVSALGRFPRHFDRMFRAFLERAESRPEMAACLERLAVAGGRD